jgi:hypothetical protein
VHRMVPVVRGVMGADLRCGGGPPGGCVDLASVEYYYYCRVRVLGGCARVLRCLCMKS